MSIVGFVFGRGACFWLRIEKCARYYAELGVEFKVCGQAAEDFGYSAKDFQDFVQIVPNAIAELGHWQLEGYALITPNIYEKRFAIEEIR